MEMGRENKNDQKRKSQAKNQGQVGISDTAGKR